MPASVSQRARRDEPAAEPPWTWGPGRERAARNKPSSGKAEPSWSGDWSGRWRPGPLMGASAWAGAGQLGALDLGAVEQAQQRDARHEHAAADDLDGQLAAVGGLVGRVLGDPEQLRRFRNRPGQTPINSYWRYGRPVTLVVHLNLRSLM